MVSKKFHDVYSLPVISRFDNEKSKGHRPCLFASMDSRIVSLRPSKVVGQVQEAMKGPHEPGHVAKELYIGAIEESLGAMALANELCTECQMPLFNADFKLVRVHERWKLTISRDLDGG